MNIMYNAPCVGAIALDDRLNVDDVRDGRHMPPGFRSGGGGGGGAIFTKKSLDITAGRTPTRPPSQQPELFKPSLLFSKPWARKHMRNHHLSH